MHLEMKILTYLILNSQIAVIGLKFLDLVGNFDPVAGVLTDLQSQSHLLNTLKEIVCVCIALTIKW